MEGGLWLHLLNRLCYIHTNQAMFIWALSQERERAEIRAQELTWRSLKPYAVRRPAWWTRTESKWHLFTSFEGIGCVNKQSLKIFISEEVKHQSFPGRLWCPQAQEKYMCQNQKPSPCWFFLLLWHQLPHSCKINLTGSSDHMCLEIKTRARLSESFNETELRGFFFSFLFYHTRSTDLPNDLPFYGFVSGTMNLCKDFWKTKMSQPLM